MWQAVAISIERSPLKSANKTVFVVVYRSGTIAADDRERRRRSAADSERPQLHQFVECADHPYRWQAAVDFDFYRQLCQLRGCSPPGSCHQGLSWVALR